MMIFSQNLREGADEEDYRLLTLFFVSLSDVKGRGVRERRKEVAFLSFVYLIKNVNSRVKRSRLSTNERKSAASSELTRENEANRQMSR